MIITTTHSIENFLIDRYIGIVTGEAVVSGTFISDWIASIKNVIGGQVKGYQSLLLEGNKKAISIMIERAKSIGANAIIGVDFDYGVIAPKGIGTVLLITVSGTAVSASQKRLQP